jgi:uncharacterized membrane protein YsdA (DUF1294 family)
MFSILIYYLIIINLFAFSIMGYDKQSAKKRKRRVPERYLFIYALIGGSVGAFIGMRVFRHKTQHSSFQYGIPAIILLHTAAAVYFLKLY